MESIKSVKPLSTEFSVSKLTIIKWVAGFNMEGRLVAGTLSVRETPKTYIVIDPQSDEYEALRWAVNFRTNFFKDKMYDTEREAIMACVEKYDAAACVAKVDYDRAINKFETARDGLAACDAS
jgi:hypothetical protein